MAKYDATVVGVPFDGGATYRAGTRFGPQGIRRISSLYTPYNYGQPPAPTPETPQRALSGAAPYRPPSRTPARHTSPRRRDGRRPARADDALRRRRRLHDPGKPREVFRPDLERGRVHRGLGLDALHHGARRTRRTPCARAVPPSNQRAAPTAPPPPRPGSARRAATTPSASRRCAASPPSPPRRSGSSTSTATPTSRRRTWTSACTRRRGSTPQTCQTSAPRTWCKLGSEAGRCRAWRWRRW